MAQYRVDVESMELGVTCESQGPQFEFEFDFEVGTYIAVAAAGVELV